MSDQWETVGKTKSSPNSKKNGKKPVKPMPKLEDILPKGSLKAMYTDFEPENSKVQEVPPPKPKDQKKPKEEPKKKKEPLPPQPKVPKDIQEAVKANLRVDDMRKLIDVCQTKFPDSPLLWLRDLASYLNIKLVNEGSSELNIFDGLPLSALSPNMKKAIFSMVQGVSEGMQEVYAETCIANIGHEMNKNLSVYGWITIAQVLAEVNPRILTTNMNRLIELRNSYQNRPPICIAILRALGQSGKFDLNIGLRIWLDMMVPLITMKHYTKFVVDYLTNLLDEHNITATTKVDRPAVDITNFLTLQDTVFNVSGQIHSLQAKHLNQQYPRLKNVCLGGYSNHELFPAVMEKLDSQSHFPNQVLDSLDILSNCLIKSQAALVHWQKLYISQLAESCQLLQYIQTNWDNLQGIDTPLFRETIQAFDDYNSTVMHKEEAQISSDSCNAIMTKLFRKNVSWFPWKGLSLLLLVGLATMIKMDVQKNQNFGNSHLGALLKDLGHYDRVCAIRDVHVNIYLAGHTWVAKNAPVYYAMASKHTGPLLQKGLDNAKVGADFARVKLTELILILKVYGEDGMSYVEDQVPGLKASFTKLVFQAQELIVSGFDVVRIKATELTSDVDWAQVKSNVSVQMETVKNVIIQTCDNIIQQVNQLVK